MRGWAKVVKDRARAREEGERRAAASLRISALRLLSVWHAYSKGCTLPRLVDVPVGVSKAAADDEEVAMIKSQVIELKGLVTTSEERRAAVEEALERERGAARGLQKGLACTEEVRLIAPSWDALCVRLQAIFAHVLSEKVTHPILFQRDPRFSTGWRGGVFLTDCNRTFFAETEGGGEAAPGRGSRHK